MTVQVHIRQEEGLWYIRFSQGDICFEIMELTYPKVKEFRESINEQIDLILEFIHSCRNPRGETP